MDELLEKIKDHKLVAGLAATIIILASLAGFLWLKPEEKAPALPQIAEMSQKEDKPEEASSSAFSKEKDRILVDVKGAVQKEGVYELEPDARVKDAIEMAGGLSPEADKNSVNLAQKLEDEAVVSVARLGEEGGTTATKAGPEPSPSGKVKLNRATVSDLMTISGIGQKRAEDIIAYREEHGKFKSIDELTNVSGIGAKTLEKFKGEMTLD